MVVCNTSPLNYLIQIGAVELLSALYREIHVPRTVVEELRDPAAPIGVRSWAAAPPAWLMIHAEAPAIASQFEHLHRGEAAAIALATAMRADLLLMDDLDGRLAAANAGLVVMGTLGVLDGAARNDLGDFHMLLEALLKTNFRAPRRLIEALKERHRRKR